MKRAFYYCWYSKSRHWNEGTIMTPKAGFYDSADSSLIERHIKLVKKRNIDNLCVSWWGINSYEDKIFRDCLYRLFNQNMQKFSFLFELSRYLNNNQQGSCALEESNIKKVVKEIEYLAVNYEPIKSNPLEVFIYLSRVVTNIGSLMYELHSLKARYPYLRFIGDEVYWFKPKDILLTRYKLFDAISLYNPHISDYRIIEGFWNNTFELYVDWNSFCKKFDLNFYPTIILGFDDSAVRPELNHPVIPRNYKAMKSLMMKLKELGLEDLYICSFNEWHENTQIEE